MLLFPRFTNRNPFQSCFGDENCLTLNIYYPANATAKLPVMVWFYGGSFWYGKASDSVYAPDYLVAKDILLVTVNYRLGPLGFLAYPEGGISGNAGLKDQQLALKWISDNVNAFGGDKDNVTIFGTSAGAAACQLHLLNDTSRRYFHKAICQSGSALCGWARRTTPEKAVKLAKLIAGKEEKMVLSPSEVVKILETASVKDLLVQAYKTATLQDLQVIPMAPFTTFVEPDSPTAFLTKTPEELARSFKNDTHPVIYGYNGSESNDLVKDWQMYKDDSVYMPLIFGMPERVPEIAKQVKEFYFDNGEVTEKNLNRMGLIRFDNYILWAISMAIDAHLENKSK